MDCLTIKRGDDGFGSQFFSIISGVIFCLKHNIPYSHREIENIKLIDKDINQNEEVILANKLINDVIKNLNVNSCKLNCEEKPFCHDIIYDVGGGFYYTDEILDSFKKSYLIEKPEIYKNDKINIAIHIRRGDDIPFNNNSVYGDSWQKNLEERWIKSEVYDEIITKLLSIYPNSLIHILSWGNPKLNVVDERIIYHIVNSGEKFIDDFNLLITSDILVVGSSTFSISAGFLNPNKVICSNEICKLPRTPIPPQWIKNYNEILDDGNSFS